MATLQKWLEQAARPTWNTLELAITNAHREEMDLKPLKEMPIQRVKNEEEDQTQGENAKKLQYKTKPDCLDVHFGVFLTTIRESLEKCKDRLETCKEFCSNLTISGNSEVLLFNNEQIMNINNCSSFKELFFLLRQCWSWKEYSFLKAIIAQCESSEAEAELDKFEKLMSSYCGMKLISDKYSPDELPMNYIKLCITVEKPYKSLTLQDFDELRTFIFKYLDVKQYIALPFIKFLFSSLHLEWYIPLQAASHVVKMAVRNKGSLTAELVTLIQVGNRIVLDVRGKERAKHDLFSILLDNYFAAGEESKSIWTCQICCQAFKNTRYLPCHHFFCEECLESIKEQSKIICPECRRVAVVPADGIKSLPNNLFNHIMDKLMLKYNWRMETEIKWVNCGACDPITAFCTNCKAFLCDFCQESHKNSKSCFSHNLVPLSELGSNKDVNREVLICQNHGLRFDYYCETCKVLACKQCIYNQHLNHKYSTIRKSAARYQSELRKSANTMENIMVKNLIEAQDQIDRRRKLISQQSEKVNQEIDQYYEDLVLKLMEQKEQLKQHVRDTVLEKEDALIQQLKEIKHMQAEVLSVKEMSDTIAKRSVDEELLSAKSQMTILMKKLNDNFEKLNIRPIESANVKIAYTDLNASLQQFAKDFTTIDSLSFEVENPVEVVKQGETVTLEIIAKVNSGDYYRSGGSQVSARLKSSTGQTNICVTDNDNGTYIASFKVQEVGKMQLSVFVSGQQIKGSPFSIIVQRNQATLDKSSTTMAKGDGNMGKLWSIAYSESDLWAVADRTKNCVSIYDGQDQLIERFGSQGEGEGQFQYPCGIAFDDDNALYVTDSHNHRVQKFSIFGKYLLQFGSKGADKGQLNYPVGITTSYDKVFVADRQNSRISVFQTDGQFCYSMGEGKLSRYFDVMIVNSLLQVSDWSHHCIYTFTLDGHYCGKFAAKPQRKNI